jgi:hypothetical protein
MARKSNNTTTVQPSSKLKIFYAELDGTPQTIEEALRTVASIRQPVIVPAPARAVIDAPANGTQAEQPNLFNHETYSDDTAEEVCVDVDQQSDAENTRQPRGSGPKVDRNASLQVLPDLDFYPSNNPTLQDFFTEKNPKTDMEKILVTCWFLQEKMGTSPVGLDHIYTALKHLSEPLPKDLGGTVRNMKNKKGWLKFSKTDDVKVATEGENFVNHKLPAAAK